MVRQISSLQERLYAEDRRSLLLIFQAMDAAGKDSTIRAVLRGINPAGVRVHSFKKPSSRELGHDFLWRSVAALPEKGMVGVFNRSYYEETLVVRVHPHYLSAQGLELPDDAESFWQSRFASIRDHERHLAENGTTILKFWLNVSRDEQRRRFLSRIDESHKHWKFNPGDLPERARWDDYMHAYQETLRATSRAHAPWFAIPADDKPFMRRCVADIVLRTLLAMDPQWPSIDEDDRAEMLACRAALVNET